MTDLMTAIRLILVHPTCTGDQRALDIWVISSLNIYRLSQIYHFVLNMLHCWRQTKGVQFQLTCHLCRESHTTQVWLCFLVLSLLSTSTCAAPEPPTFHLQNCLRSVRLKNAIERSEAMLYAPSTNDIKENCEMISLRCYMLELKMVIIEEEIVDNKAHCIFDFMDILPTDPPVDCPPCEAYSLKNITVFLERLNSLLQKMNSWTT